MFLSPVAPENLVSRDGFGSSVSTGACHYLTNRFQMEAPVAPSRSLREASKKPPWVWLKPSRSLREAFSEASQAFSARDVFIKRS